MSGPNNDPNTAIAEFQRFEASYSGPLPPAEDLRKYDEVLPGAAERIMKMAEAQSGHRRDLEQRIIRIESRNSFAGILFAAAICIIAVVISAVLILRGHETAGTIIGGTSLVGLVSVFIYGTRANRNNGSE
jgi:uncharacterized membrane protein